MHVEDGEGRCSAGAAKGAGSELAKGHQEL